MTELTLQVGDRYRVVNPGGIEGWEDVAPFGSEGTVKAALPDALAPGYDVYPDGFFFSDESDSPGWAFAFTDEIEGIVTAPTPLFQVGEEVEILDYSGVVDNNYFPSGYGFDKLSIGDTATVQSVKVADEFLKNLSDVQGSRWATDFIYKVAGLFFRQEALGKISAVDPDVPKVGDYVRILDNPGVEKAVKYPELIGKIFRVDEVDDTGMGFSRHYGYTVAILASDFVEGDGWLWYRPAAVEVVDEFTYEIYLLDEQVAKFESERQEILDALRGLHIEVDGRISQIIDLVSSL